MNIKQARDFFQQHGNFNFDEGEADEIFDRVMEHLTHQSKLDIKLNKTLTVDESEFKSIVNELSSNKPIQYIVGYEWFYNLKLLVNEHVLIPRPETAELVRWVLEHLKEKKASNPIIIDIGTGSGCIPIVIKNEWPRATLYAMDVSHNAIELAKKNALISGTDIHFVEDDILHSNFQFDQTFDIIISNPPYITSEEKKDMHERVINYEPSIALFVSNNDPLQFYKAILQFANQHLSPQGVVFLELNCDYAHETAFLFQEAHFETTLRKDMYGNMRMLMAMNKKEKPTVLV